MKMKALYDEMIAQRGYYERLMKQAERSLRKAPKEGRLRVANRKGKPQYYLVTESMDYKGKYIRKEDSDCIRKLAQRDYDLETQKLAKQCYEALDKSIQRWPMKTIADIYSDNPGRRHMIVPYELTDEEYVRAWEKVEYDGKEFSADDPEQYTNRGERVRSKSERIIANRIYELGIPYRYEYPLYLEGYGIVYPDFTLLDIATRKEVYLEHLGRMDDWDYSQKAMQKIHDYERNGFYIGNQLILTYETQKMPLDTRILDSRLKRFIQ